jgi:hypothetical protein
VTDRETTPVTDADRLRRAKDYPYAIPPGSFSLEAGTVYPMEGPFDIPDRTRRTPVIATGSNLSPERLRDKFANDPAPVPVVRATLGDFDSVHSAHLTSYGSIAATPYPAPGTTVTVAVLWLTEDQLTIMHATESLGVNYAFRRWGGLDLTLDDGETLDQAYSYVSLHGALNLGGNPAPLAAIAATGRHWPAFEQPAILAHVRDRLAAGTDLDAFILSTIGDANVRARHSKGLCADALPIRHSAGE